MPWNSSGFKVVGRLAKSIHGEAQAIQNTEETREREREERKDETMFLLARKTYLLIDV